MKFINKSNSVWLAFQYSFSLITAIVSIKLNLLNFGKEIFGIWLLISSIWGFGAALDFGFATAMVKYVAEYNKTKQKLLTQLVSSGFFVFIILGTMILIIGFVLNYILYFANADIIPKASHPVFYKVLFFLALAFYLRYVSIFLKSVLDGLNAYVITSKVALIYNFLLVVSVFVVYILKLGVVALAVLYLICAIVVLIAYIIIFKIKYPTVLKLQLFPDVKLMKEIFSFSLTIQLSNIFAAAIDPLIKFILSSYYNVEFIPIYEIARRLAISISNLFFSTFKTIIPEASLLTSPAEIKDFLIHKANRISNFGTLFSGLCFGVLSTVIVVFAYYWFGEKEIIVIFVILSLPETINNFGFSIYGFLIGRGMAGYIAISQALNLILFTAGLYLTLLFWGSNLGLLAYYISVIIVNLFLFSKAFNNFNKGVFLFLRKSKIQKLIILNFLQLVLILILKLNFLFFAIPFGVFSFLSLLIFISDFKHYGLKLIRK